jgi:hypothetical protein
MISIIRRVSQILFFDFEQILSECVNQTNEHAVNDFIVPFGLIFPWNNNFTL